jgi:acid phosphatase
MGIWTPSRRELIAGAPLLAGAAALPRRLFAAPAFAPLKFLVVGDWGRDGKKGQSEVAARMGEAAEGIAFVASTGDNFYLRGVSSSTDRQWETSFEQIYTDPRIVEKTWFPVLGNHDYGGNVEAQVRRTEERQGRWQMRGRWYGVSREDLHRDDLDLFFIDTVAWQGKEAFPFDWLGSPIHREDQAAQIKWLDGALGASTARFKLVFGHHGIYSIGPHGGAMRMKELDDVLRAHGVAAYVNGHDHCLYHISRDGLHYVCSGGGSEVLATYTGGNESGCVFHAYCAEAHRGTGFPLWQYFSADRGFATFEVHEQHIEVEMVGLGATNYNHHRFTILEPALARQAARAS